MVDVGLSDEWKTLEEELIQLLMEVTKTPVGVINKISSTGRG